MSNQLPERDIPPVKIVQALQVHEGDDFTYTYPNMADQLEKQRVFLGDRWAYYEATDTESLEHTDESRGLALYYIVKTAEILGQAATEASRKLWSERFTAANIEVYGAPDQVGLSQLAKQFLSNSDLNTVPSEVRMVYEQAAKLDTSESATSGESLVPGEITQAYHEYITTTYADLFACIEEDKTYAPADIEATFQTFLDLLADRDDAWRQWKVEQRDQTNCEVVGTEHTIVVGAKRKPATALNMKNLLVHEILTHALRRVNGEKTNNRMVSEGIPGYIDFEEGLSVFNEYVTTGKVPDRAFDRYFDTGLAMGLVDGSPWPKEKMLHFVTLRQKGRKIERGEPIDEQKLKEEMHKYIRRIYRGGPGEIAGGSLAVMPKDCGYFDGFRKASSFIQTAYENGSCVEDIFTYLVSGKFDATDTQHTDRMAKHGHTLSH